ncbi:hypothetical protein C4B25_02755 [Mycoplasma todarodis]|uniref:Uncharacterized protein n=2 Tax=Mycoplasma todarodis TaxID=1937191 RepID=A0A4R0XN55_9MOLU|nr:hypothetical protein C4B25_02755 [Mycoplasma todarodis]
MRNAIILVFTLSIFIGIDQFTKIYAFSKSTPEVIDSLGNRAVLVSEGKLFGMRLVTNTGMFSSLGEGTIPYGGVQTITSLIAILVILSALFSKNKIMVFGFSLIASGALGNIMDRYMLIDTNGGHYVRDWIYNPGHDKGTYNIADIEVVFGSPIAAIGLLIGMFKDSKEEKKTFESSENKKDFWATKNTETKQNKEIKKEKEIKNTEKIKNKEINKVNK